MPILDKNNAADVGRYNAFIRSSPHRALTQDLNWSHVKDDWGNEQVYLEEEGEIVAAMSLLIKRVPGGYSLLYAPRGPVCDVYDEKKVAALIKEAEPLAKKHKAFALKMDPEAAYDDRLDRIYRDAGYTVHNSEAGKDDLIQPRMNMIVQLDGKDEETLMAGFRKKTRNLIRSAAKKGVETSWARTDDYLTAFYDIYKTMAERNHITTRSYEYFVKLRDNFEGLRVYLMTHEGDKLAGAVTINYNGKMYYLYAGSTNVKRNMNPNHLMNFEMMKWGLDEGAVSYDLGGIFSTDSEKDGLYSFKKSFFNDEEESVTTYIGEIDHVYKPFLYSMFVKVVPKVQQLKKKLKRN
ncbi:lipid II:glycine glycyltransferase FemX [Sporosarcina trichiuri]|uniref:lipid II:glycine glycyltransferase FemX n=1 Tax=Sporosarcina trichiuri TaxID=3056445 RepID=UPI0025B2A0BE|nr:peptidoglycan bridge formation glycyltransferase FemA/FemB family protein [Sporosarcina sp. 0.2-SM1T-5]WJY27631.1 peptidoglycan bridge formation glycyltransferase FemA/FemB family protein [Sporosarcina sp. 0.2-SM1T-5]